MSDALYIAGAIAALVLCSFLTRAGYFLWGDHFQLSDGVRKALRYAPTAALVGIVVPEVLPWQAGAGPVFDVKVLAAAVAVLVFLRTGNAVHVIVAGMVAFWVLRALIPI
ncbi:AzlD domain-containing protein [Pusillimonas sp. TS35]|uniref:AzlD domain-containing protein n=1 Tax=Paracandidimonas lactea TaxID=2895524 RepID=UPI00136A977A|nr:AzlD domain-containing protein [Paracandidimonas lactea]MYN14543.1 AzlD domain-containing protein [Pusillimonas sp. TS35]